MSKILITGISSFTGYHFAKTLAGMGHEVTGIVTGKLSDYEGLKSLRLGNLENSIFIVEEASFGSENFMLSLEGNSWDFLCHHGAYVEGYQNDSFDLQKALKNNLNNIEFVFKTLAKSKAGFIYTSTYAEKGEGSDEAASLYGLSKGFTHDICKFWAERHKVSMLKFVIPNPFGPLEEKRFGWYIMNQWKNGETAEVKTPDYIRDNIHISLLSEVYGSLMMGSLKEPYKVVSPSQYAETQGKFTARLAKEVKQRTGLECKYSLNKQTSWDQPKEMKNHGLGLQPKAWSESAAWDKYVRYYFSTI